MLSGGDIVRSHPAQDIQAGIRLSADSAECRRDRQAGHTGSWNSHAEAVFHQVRET